MGGRSRPNLRGAIQFFQVPYTALTMILTPSPRERDSATAYRECGSVFRREQPSFRPGSLPRHFVHALSAGMTMEMAGTLMGATVHGLIVSSAHGSQRCEDTVHPRSTAVSPDVVSV